MTSRDRAGGYENWGELRDHLIDAFHETPHPATEADIITAYELHPTAVERAASETVVAVKTGTARSGWGVLRSRAAKISTPVSNPTRSSSVDREKLIGRAEQEIRNAGLYIDREAELILHLFDPRGLLHPYAQADFDRGTADLTLTGDHTLIARMTTVWQQHRPTGQQLEQEATERAERWKTQHASTSRSSAANSTAASTSAQAPTRTSPQKSVHSLKSTPSSPSSTSPKPPTPTSEKRGNGYPAKPTTRSSTASTSPSPASNNDDLPL